MCQQARLLEQFRVSSNLIQCGNDSLVALTLASAARNDKQFTDSVIEMLDSKYPESKVMEIYNELVGA